MLRRALTTVVALVLLPATVQAFDHHHHHHHHHASGDHGGGGCGGASSEASSSPRGGASGDGAAVPTTAPGKRVFVTATSYSGAVGGLDAADRYCTSSAQAAGLSGTYRAWLSAGTTRASDRVDGDGPWLTTRGELAFASRDALGGPPALPLRDENGEPVATDAAVWSGTDAAGEPSGLDCEEWRNATSDASGTVGLAGEAVTCDARASLLCFEE